MPQKIGDGEDEVPTIEEAINSAFDAAGDEDSEELEDTSEDEETSEDEDDPRSEDEDDEEPEDESGDEEPSDDDGDEEEEDAGEEEERGESEEEDGDEGDEDPDGDSGGDDGGDDEQTSSAPASWDPVAREHWKDVPNEIKETILAREKQISDTLGQTTQVRQFAAEWAEMIHPYQGLMAAQGATPKQAVNRLLEIGAGLAMGNTTQKADIIKELINQYQIDLPTLDSMLAGEQPPPGQPVDVQSEIQKALQEERDRNTAAATEAEEQRLADEIEEFSRDRKKAEFFEDVRLDMADLLSVAAQRGRSMSLEDAYNQACQLNPKVKQVLDQRVAAAAAKKKKSAANKKKAAASSIKGKPGTQNTSEQGELSVDDAVAAAWDRAEKRQRQRI